MSGTKKALCRELVREAFERLTDGIREVAVGKTGLAALPTMSVQYYESLADRTNLLLQLQGFAACGDPEVRAAVRSRFARMCTVAETTGLEPVTVKSFLAFGMLLNTAAAPDVEHVDMPWADGVRTRINAGL